MTKISIDSSNNVVVINFEIYILESVRSFILEKDGDYLGIKNVFTDKLIARDLFKDWYVQNLTNGEVLSPYNDVDQLINGIVDLLIA